MNFTVSSVAKSLSEYLIPYLPGVSFVEDPNQQGLELPCWFLQQRYSNLEKQVGGYWLRKIGLDLTYLEDYDLPDLQKKYQSAAESLDLVMDNFSYSDGTESGNVIVRTYDREWHVDLDALHYKFEIRERVTFPENGTAMQKEKTNITIKKE